MSDPAELRFSPRPNRAHEIEWRTWSEDVFAEARRTSRPILLSLSAVWCHWCHVMDETTYSDPEVVTTINREFVPVRVDNDKHPDINRRYNMGGWPTTAFLTASGEVIAGATYVPPAQMLASLRRISDFFAANRDALTALTLVENPAVVDSEALSDVHALASSRRPSAPTRGHERPSRDLLLSLPDRVVATAVGAADPVYGGFGTLPKFPQTAVLELLDAYGRLHADDDLGRDAQAVVARSLRALVTSPIRDRIAGGFFRYATQRDWSAPHFEKMLEDNARIAYLLTGVCASRHGSKTLHAIDDELHDSVEQAAADTLDYLLLVLHRSSPPSFGGSQDADEAYYSRNAEDRRRHRAPSIDPTIIVDWNALAARALLRAAWQWNRVDMLASGLEVLDFLWQAARGAHPETVAHFLQQAEAPTDYIPLLVDQATLASALLDAYEATGQRHFRARAESLVDWSLEHLRAADGRMLDRFAAPDQSAGLLTHPAPAIEENALFTDTLWRLTSYAGAHHARIAERQAAAWDIAAAWETHVDGLGIAAAALASAVLRELSAPPHVRVVGPRQAGATQSLHLAALRAQHPFRTVQLLDPQDPEDAADLAAAGIVPMAEPAALVCRGETCSSPMTDTEQLSAALGTVV
ncbi:MAG: DUF255 domain-containing protein [Thermoleophilia bacterium]